MWTDNETEKDFLNFGSIAKTVAEVISQAQSRPISIGVSGAWGVGKSSMIKLVEKELRHGPNQESGERTKYIFVEFNAWLYQGYDDARAALIEVVASTLEKEAESRKSGLEKARALAERVNWFRALKASASSIASLSLGLPPTGLLSELIETGKSFSSGEIDQETIDAAEQNAQKIAGESKSLLKQRQKPMSPPKEIEALRHGFEDVLQEMNVTLVVLIDDLDRCLPETTISTLEAIRLLLFLKNTAFVIAADDQMIKHAVKRHFQGVEDELVTSYFDKLIQVPIRVPPLGTQEVRAYMMMLFIENSAIAAEDKEKLREEVCCQLSKTWQGKRVDLRFLRNINESLPDDLIAKLDTADRLAPLMTSTTGISGNPRLIKRFLNALSIRMSMSKAQGVGVDESVLAKILLFERCGNPKAYAELIKSVTESNDGKPSFLLAWEQSASGTKELKLQPPWDQSFETEWLRIPPQLGEVDLRGALYVSREHAPMITPEDRLSTEAVELLEGILRHPEMAPSYKNSLVSLPVAETAVIMDRLFDKARQEQEWGVPPVLHACITLAQADQTQGARLAGFLKDRPGSQIKPSIVPKISDESWSKSVFAFWIEDEDIAPPVKAAIRKSK